MTYNEIFSRSKQIVEQYDATDVPYHIAAQVNITGEGEGAFYIELHDGKFVAEPYEYYDRDCLFTADSETVLEVLDGSLNIIPAITLGRMKVEGNIEKLLTLVEIAEKYAKEKDSKKKKRER